MSNRRAVRIKTQVQHAPQQTSTAPKKLTAAEISAAKARSRIVTPKANNKPAAIKRSDTMKHKIHSPPNSATSVTKKSMPNVPKRGTRQQPVAEVHDVVQRKPVQARPVRQAEGFKPPAYVNHTKTANQIRQEKLNAHTNSIDPEEYARIKSERIKEMNREKTVVKAKIVESKHLKTLGDEESHYKYEYAEEEMDSWEEIKPEKKKKSKKKTDDSQCVKKSMAMIGRKHPSERIKVKDTDKDKYDVEDLEETDVSGRKGHDKFSVSVLNNLNRLVNRNVHGNNRDILLVGLSESTKDAVIDLLMETELGNSGLVFDTTLEENETKEIPEAAFAIFSEKVPILPLEERDEESSEEDGVKARSRATKKLVKPKPTKKKTVLAVGDDYEEPPFNIKEDYPSVRFIFLVKVSAYDRVDIKKLHENLAPFAPFEKFKKLFIELTRAECLLVDTTNHKQLFHVDL